MAIHKRGITLDDYNSANHYWTLSSWEFPEPAVVENLVQVPGRLTGPLDLSTALTDGEPRYSSRTFRATLEISDGTREDRLGLVSRFINRFHGRACNLVLPDHPGHYAVGRFTVRELYNDLSHAAVEVAGVCEPWLYAAEETTARLNVTTGAQTATLTVGGVMPVVPVVTISGTDAEFHLEYQGSSWSLSAGVYRLPDLRLAPGEHTVTFSGSGSAVITYREAVLR